MQNYVDKDLLVDSRNDLLGGNRKMNAFLGLLTLLIHGTQVSNQYWRIDMVSFAKHLDDVFYLSDEKPHRSEKKEWFLLLQPEWVNQVMEVLLKGQKVSIQSCAVMLMWNRPFESLDSLVNTFINEIGARELVDECFTQELTATLLSNEKCSNEILNKAFGSSAPDLTINFDKGQFLAKTAGDINAAPFFQTLYSGTTLRKVFSICDFDFLETYNLKSASQPLLTNPHLKLTSLPKPFLLLAGISGTGKTRFVTEQAKWSALQHGLNDGDNYCLVPVRPDWHEPSDLLGYVSRINGTRYVATTFLKFIVKAMVAAVESVNNGNIQWKQFADVPPFWLCLDEMNLAPVEQYFADYLSILETREWTAGGYSSKAIMPSDILQQLAHCNNDIGGNSLDALWNELFADFKCDFKNELSEYFQVNGIPLPPNLIVAGTVNMDETTHGFSRKVIDRALTIDFQEFFPNDYDTFFSGQNNPKMFTFPQYSVADKGDLPEIDANDSQSKSVEFLKKINAILKNTPFELAYRALNELLLSVVCFSPKNGEELLAVWDDFLMQKVLPRMEGDSQKLKFFQNAGAEPLESEYLKKVVSIYGKGSVLHQLYALLETDQLAIIWGDESDKSKRPDLLRDTTDMIECRSKKKLLWMMKRLKANHFTDFWV